MDLNLLKGEKKIQAILSLGEDFKNAPLLFSLIESEKGNYKQTAIQCLANFDYEPAFPLWKKLIKSKNKGEKIFLKTSAESISEIVANEFYQFLSSLFEKPDGYSLTELELSNFKTFISLMLGKASVQMQKVYFLVAKNTSKLSSFNFTTNTKGLFINDYIRFFDPSPKDIKKIFPAILSMSIIKSMDERLVKLTEELNFEYGENWISPLFMSELLTKTSVSVFNKFSPELKGVNAHYLLDSLAAIYFDKKQDKHVGLLFWGQHNYGEIDTRFVFSRPLFENLNEKWFSLLTEMSVDKLTLQAYNRGGVLYEAYDEMFVELIPQLFTDKNVEQKVKEYFIKKAEKHNGASTLYIEALNILHCEVNESLIEKFISCNDNAVSKYSLRVEINQFTNWSNERKLEFYKKLPSKLVMKEEIEKLQI